VGGVAFSPDGQWIATASDLKAGDTAVPLREARTGKEVRRLTGHSHFVLAVAFSPVLDACHSETALPLLAKLAVFRGLGAAEHKAIQMLARATGVHLIAASTKQQYAFEVPELGHGILTYALLSGLGEKEPARAPTTPTGWSRSWVSCSTSTSRCPS
jgi:uncharacterized caspase-like protein